MSGMRIPLHTYDFKLQLFADACNFIRLQSVPFACFQKIVADFMPSLAHLFLKADQIILVFSTT